MVFIMRSQFHTLVELTQKDDIMKKFDDILFEELEKVGLSNPDREVTRNYLTYCFKRYEADTETLFVKKE